MRRGNRAERRRKRECARPGFVEAAVALGLVVAMVGLDVPLAGGARQVERYASTNCGGTVKRDPNANFKVRLAISRKTVPPGGAVRIWIENAGAVDAAYGYPYRLQRYEQGSWVKLPTGPFFSARLTVRSGRAGICQVIHLAGSSPPGVYRVSKSAWPAEATDERPKAVVRATFRVMACGGRKLTRTRPDHDPAPLQ
jgi:hypothetical protein